MPWVGCHLLPEFFSGSFRSTVISSFHGHVPYYKSC